MPWTAAEVILHHVGAGRRRSGPAGGARLDPVTIWAGEECAFEDFSGEDRQALADAFYTAIHDELAKDYQIVTAPGPGVLQVQVALTEAQASYPTLDTISTIVPQSLLLSQTMGLATGKPSCLG